MASLFSLTPTPSYRESSQSISIRSASPHVSFGAKRRQDTIRFTSTCGTVTLTTPSTGPGPASFHGLPGLPHDEGGPVFEEPWQAQAFAMAVRLSAHGYFTWKEWADALAGELAA